MNTSELWENRSFLSNFFLILILISVKVEAGNRLPHWLSQQGPGSRHFVTFIQQVDKLHGAHSTFNICPGPALYCILSLCVTSIKHVYNSFFCFVTKSQMREVLNKYNCWPPSLIKKNSKETVSRNSLPLFPKTYSSLMAANLDCFCNFR